MSELAGTLIRYNADDLLSTESMNHADEAVAEVFGMMLGFNTEVLETTLTNPDLEGAGAITVVVGFSGAMMGNCEIRMATSAARSITAAMLGEEVTDEEDGSMNDAVGELCNMLAGGWKRRIDTLRSDCSLSPPTVISGKDYKVHTRMSSVQLTRTYRFEDHLMQLTLRCVQAA
jgi:chemotaxis protein CheX